ncbi:MAG TPA: isoprenylcysteine carboxylmethyltransferase family protein [Rhizomicrobium sp.]|nr:isoprenylcysteine carboxylmethyltransferase family protein [Rhizomicrobium sp.]
MGGLFALLYGVVAYVAFLATFLYAIAFIGDLPVPKTIDSGPAGALWPSVVIDAILLGIFAVQHSVMARQGFKRVWTRLVPPAVERTTYVLASTLALALILWKWQPLPQDVWLVTNPVAAQILMALFWAGWAILFISTFLINHFDLFGLQQVYARFRGSEVRPPEFRTPLFYRVVRHPLYLGFLISFWATPRMTLGHLLFSVATTGYIFIGMLLEERDLEAHFGERYVTYKRSVSMILPLPRRR